MRVGIIGAGFSGKVIAGRFLKGGVPVWGTTRADDKAANLADSGLTPVIFDGINATPTLLDALAETTHLVISIAPPREADSSGNNSLTDPTLRALQELSLKDSAPNLQWVGYLSTVGVYGNHDGAWVTEETEVAPVSERSLQRVRAEADWLTFREGTGIPVGIFRLSGIYGPGRNALRTAEQGKARRLIKKDQVFNRIHVADIAQALFLAAHKAADGVFNITDDEPAPPQDVVTYAHQLLGMEPPQELDFETVDLTPMARSFYGENKRVSNAKSKDVMGMVYQFPNYRVALDSLFRNENWR